MPLAKVLMSHGVDYHKFADDQHYIVFFDPAVAGELDAAMGKLRSCILEISPWMASMKLILNPGKTEFLVVY